MKLHENKEEFENLIALTSAEFGISDVLVEKDYWVTLALKNLSSSGHGGKVVFKGGTSLSKAHKLIQRFSEDIDLAVIVEEGANDNAIKKHLKAIEEACTRGFVEVEEDPRISKKGRFRKTVWKFPKISLKGEYGDAGENILIEVNSFTKPEPHEDVPLNCMIADFLTKKGFQNEIKQFELEPFLIAVLRVERTFVEKMSAITKGCYLSTDNSYDVLKKNIRHFYDLTKIIHLCSGKVLEDEKFLLELLQRVKEDDKKMDPKGDWAGRPYKEAAIFKDFDNVWKEIAPAYNGQFKNMLYGEEKLPDEKKVKETILLIAAALNKHEV